MKHRMDLILNQSIVWYPQRTRGNIYYKSEVLQGNLDTSFNDFKILSSTIRKNQNIINAMNAGVFFTKNIFFNPKTFEEIETTYKFD